MKEKIAIWGLGLTYRTYRPIIEKLEDIGKIDVVAYVDTVRRGQIRGKNIISKDRLSEYSFDRVVVTAVEKKEPIKRDIEATLPNAEYVFADEYEPFKTEVLKGAEEQVGVLRCILSASDNEIRDYEWMLAKVRKYGCIPFSDMDFESIDITWRPSGLYQRPKEFAKYLNYLSTFKVDSCLEIGVAGGASSYIMCAVLARRNPDLKYFMMDITDNIIEYDIFKDILPQLEKKIPMQSRDFQGQKFDYVFVDGDHSYNGSIADFQNVGKIAGIIAAFHDIYGHEYDNEDGGTVRMWKEVQEHTQGKNHIVFSETPDHGFGIGVIEWQS